MRVDQTPKSEAMDILVLCGMPKPFRQEIQLAVSAAKVVSDGGVLEMRGEVTVEMRLVGVQG